MRFEGGFGGGWVSKGVDLQTAYAVTSHIGVMVNGALTNSRGDAGNFSERVFTRSKYLEGGIGYFTHLEENDNWVFEMFGGAGKGEYNVRYDEVNRARLSMNKYFIQPSLSFTHPRRFIELSIGSRFSGVDYYQYSFFYPNTQNYENLDRIITHPLYMFWEPSVKFSAGSKTIKGFVSYTPAISILESDFSREIINFNIGLRLVFNASQKR